MAEEKRFHPLGYAYYTSKGKEAWQLSPARSRLKRAKESFEKELKQKYPEAAIEVKAKGSGFEATIAEKGDVAEARWRQEIRKKYPSSTYNVQFTGKGAQIELKPHLARKFGQMERYVAERQAKPQLEFFRQAQLQISPSEARKIARLESQAARRGGMEWAGPTRQLAMTPEQFQRSYGVEAGVPESAIITGIRETSQGYRLTYEMPTPSWRETTITGKVSGFFEGLTSRLPEYRDIYGPWYVGPTRKQQAGFLPGFIGTFEAYVRPEVPTPSGAVISSAWSYMPETKLGPWTIGEAPPTTEPLKELSRQGPGYVLGGIFGEITQSLIISEVASKIWGKLPTRVTGPIEKTVSRVTTPIKEGIAKVPGLRRLVTPKVETLSQMGEFEVAQLTPEEYVLTQYDVLKTTSKPVSYEYAAFVEDLMKHTRLTQLEAGGSEISKVILHGNPSAYYFQDTFIHQAMTTKPVADIYLEALKGSREVFTVMGRDVTTRFPLYVTKASLRDYTAFAWWGIIDEKYLASLLGKATTTVVGGGMTRLAGVEAGKQLVRLPAYVGVKYVVSPTLKPLLASALLSVPKAARPTTSPILTREKAIPKKPTSPITVTMPQRRKPTRYRPTRPTIITTPRTPRKDIVTLAMKESFRKMPSVGELMVPKLGRPLRSKPQLRPSLRETRIDVSALAEKPVQLQVAVPKVSQVLVPKQGAIQVPYPPPPEVKPSPPAYYGKPQYGYGGRGMEEILGAQWYKKRHPILGASEVAKVMVGSERKEPIKRKSRLASLILGG